MSSHYSLSLSPAHLIEWSQDAAKMLRTYCEDYDITHPVLCYRGFSGSGMGTALMIACYQLADRNNPDDPLNNVRSAFVRKERESSHGSAVERSWRYQDLVVDAQGEPVPVCFFVDDDISSGDTCYQTIKATTTWYGAELKWDERSRAILNRLCNSYIPHQGPQFKEIGSIMMRAMK